MPVYIHRFISLLILPMLLCSCSRGSYTYKERSSNIQASKQAGLFVKEFQLTTHTPYPFAVQEAWIEKVAIKDTSDRSPNEPGYRFCLNLAKETTGISLFDKATGEAVGMQKVQQHSHYTYAGSTINNCIFVDSLELTAYKEGSAEPPGYILFRSKP